MDVNALPKYPSFSLAVQQDDSYPADPPSSHSHECRQCNATFNVAPESNHIATDTPAGTEPVGQITFNNAALVIGSDFTIGSEDEISGREITNVLSCAPANPNAAAASVAVPRRGIDESVEAFYLTQQARFFGKVGSVAFRKKNEFFMRPILKRSLSLP